MLARIVIPFSTQDWKLQACTTALDAQSLHYTLVDTSQSEDSYFQLLSTLWAEQHTVLIIEQDIVLYPGLAQDLLTCPQMWCVAPYIILEDYGIALGCAKFATDLMTMLPDLPALIAGQGPTYMEHKITGDGIWIPATHWTIQDQWWKTLLEQHGFEPHFHVPAVTHLNSEYHKVAVDVPAPK